MSRVRKLAVSCLSAAAFGAFVPMVLGSTGNFTSPLTSGVVLSVDMNGGPIASANATTEGSNGPSGSPVLSPDPFGVLWSPWGGPTSTNGDGTQLPSSQSSPNVFASSITKTFGSITATITEAGTATNYAQGGGGATMNSRDRGAPSGPTADNDMFRDFIFAGGSGSNVQGTNLLQLKLTGLAPLSSYEVAAYSYDNAGSHSMNWTATPPTANLSNSGHIGYNPDPTDVFTAPADEQTITWVSGTTPAPAVFTLTSDASGTLSIYGYGGNGVTGTQNSDTTYLDGFQVAAVPEPTSLAVIGLGVLGLTARRRKA